jgi:hypothetical protein
MKNALIAAAVLALALPISSICKAQTTATAQTPASAGSTLGAVADCNSIERLPDFVTRRGDPVLDDKAPWVDDCCPM